MKTAKSQTLHPHQQTFSEIEKTVFERLRLLRQESGLTQAQWAEKFDMGLSYVKAYESERFIPSYGVIGLISKEYNISIDWLFGYSKVRIRQK